MCCCSVKCCRINFIVWSVAIILAGIAVAVLGGLIKKEDFFNSNDELKKVGTVLFAVILALGLIAIIFGLFGLCAVKCHKKCCTCCYAFWILIFTFIFGAVGVFLIILGGQSMELLDAVCGTNKSNKYTDALKDISDTLNKIDKEIN